MKNVNVLLFKTIKYGFLFFFLIFLTIFLMDSWVKKSTQTNLFSSIENIPKNKVGLLLGTGKFLKSGAINPYYSNRIDAAEKLYKSGKIEFLLVSGDNGRNDYDETTAMKEDLIGRGIPAKKIYSDYAGFRTLDSVVRAKEIFGQEKFTIISQPFHNQRAVFIANRKGMETIAFNAKKVPSSIGWKVNLREKLARVKLLLDMIVNKQPKFLGEKIMIE